MNAPEQAPSTPEDAAEEQASSTPEDAAEEQVPSTPEELARAALPPITEEMRLRAEGCIKNHVLMAVGIGVIPSALVDLVGVTAIELRLINALAEIYGFPFPDKLASYKVLISLIGATGPIYLSNALQSLFKGIPIVGFAFAVGVFSATGGASVYAVGKIFQRHFESGGAFLGADDHEIREYYRRKLREARQVVAGYVAEAR